MSTKKRILDDVVSAQLDQSADLVAAPATLLALERDRGRPIALLSRAIEDGLISAGTVAGVINAVAKAVVDCLTAHEFEERILKEIESNIAAGTANPNEIRKLTSGTRRLSVLACQQGVVLGGEVALAAMVREEYLRGRPNTANLAAARARLADKERLRVEQRAQSSAVKPRARSRIAGDADDAARHLVDFHLRPQLQDPRDPVKTPVPTQQQTPPPPQASKTGPKPSDPIARSEALDPLEHLPHSREVAAFKARVEPRSFRQQVIDELAKAKK